jgi:hypothetical protein
MLGLYEKAAIQQRKNGGKAPSPGGSTVAQTDGQRAAVVAALNDWLHASA